MRGRTKVKAGEMHGREAGFSAALLTMKLVSSSGRNDESLELGGGEQTTTKD
jgi:hypothetical protein